jgi:hypothetical protein
MGLVWTPVVHAQRGVTQGATFVPLHVSVDMRTSTRAAARLQRFDTRHMLVAPICTMVLQGN